MTAAYAVDGPEDAAFNAVESGWSMVRGGTLRRRLLRRGVGYGHFETSYILDWV